MISLQKNYYVTAPYPRQEHDICVYISKMSPGNTFVLALIHAYKINVHLKHFMDPYNLHGKVNNGYVYLGIQRGMYDIPQAGVSENKQLKDIME